MKTHEFLLHHGIERNPFAEEDAQSDAVFKRYCITRSHHPAWDKIYGNPADPSTAVIFGEKGSGKTALRLQIAEHLREHNARHPGERVFVIEYDDFNPFLDRFVERMRSWTRHDEKSLADWRLWDHMDAILSLGVTQLVDRITGAGTNDAAFAVDEAKAAALPRLARRDILLLAAFYDQSTTLPMRARWNRLRRRLRFWTWWSPWDLALAVLATALILGGLAYDDRAWLAHGWPWLAVLAAWAPWGWRWTRRTWQAWQVKRQLRVVNHHIGGLRHALMQLGRRELDNQPIPSRDRSDDRYELLTKFQSVLRQLGFTGIMILVDRVDEPQLMGGSPERMRTLVWPMLDNKFLKHPGLGVKLLLPIELSWFLSREDKTFYERSRLDKQNLIPSLEWTGESLYDVANDRLNACRMEGAEPITLRAFFDPAVSDADLIASFARMRVPRHMFKFMHRLLVEHCASFSDTNPHWMINSETFRATEALYLRDLQNFDRGLGTG